MSQWLFAVRQATHARHQRLDTQPGLLALTQPGLTRQGYARALQSLGVGVRRVEQALWAYAHSHQGTGLWILEARWPALVDDLRALGETPWSPTNDIPDPIDSVAFYAGAAYVLEGSRLGGQVLARPLLQAQPAPWPCQFLVGVGARTGERWKAFLDWAAASVSPAAIPHAVQGAVWAFDCFLQDTVAAPPELNSVLEIASAGTM